MLRAFPIMLALLALSLLPNAARAQLQHRVERGDTLSSIAQEHGVSINSLAAANGIKRTALLQIGRELQVPDTGIVYVYPGQTLSGLAKAYGVGVDELAERNQIDTQATLRSGQRLVLPGRRYARHRATRPSGGRASRSTAGKVTLYRPTFDKSVTLRLLDKQGRVVPAARNRLANLFRDRRTGKAKRPHPRLVRLLANVSRHFEGRRIVVISGYRPARGYTSRKSRHTHAAAVDIRVDGITNTELRDYCRKLRNVGVGYYPRSTFVHLDVRDQPAYWVDWSRPGEAPHYLRPGEKPNEEATASIAELPSRGWPHVAPTRNATP